MNPHISTRTKNRLGFILLDRPQALNSLSLDMIRDLTATLRAWREDAGIRAVVVHSSSPKAFCAGGDIRFFHHVGRAAPTGGSALLEDFFSEEYALNHLIHHYPKPYLALIDGVVMGGGMGISQAGAGCRLRVVTERIKMAMPEVGIGLFPDVGGSHFLSRAPGQIGAFLGVTGETIGAADALHAGLADVFVPADRLGDLLALLETGAFEDPRTVVHAFAAPFRADLDESGSLFALHRPLIDRHFSAGSVAAIAASLEREQDEFGQRMLALMRQRSPLMMCVTLAQVRRGAALTFAGCLRMERGMVRRCFEHGEVLEGVRARVIDKDNRPQWQPATLAEVTPEMVDRFFDPPWPPHAHPLRDLA